MGHGVIEVCGNIHDSTGACQSAIIGIATSWTEELNNAYIIQYEALWEKFNTKYCGRMCVRLDNRADRHVHMCISTVCGKHCVDCVCVHSGIARNVLILTCDAYKRYLGAHSH